MLALIHGVEVHPRLNGTNREKTMSVTPYLTILLTPFQDAEPVKAVVMYHVHRAAIISKVTSKSLILTSLKLKETPDRDMKKNKYLV